MSLYSVVVSGVIRVRNTISVLLCQNNIVSVIRFLCVKITLYLWIFFDFNNKTIWTTCIAENDISPYHVVVYAVHTICHFFEFECENSAVVVASVQTNCFFVPDINHKPSYLRNMVYTNKRHSFYSVVVSLLRATCHLLFLNIWHVWSL